MARGEVNAFAEYDYVVVNDDIDSCAERIRSIILAGRARLEPMRGDAERIARTFDDDLESA